MADMADKNVGRFTFRGLSVIDYTISSVLGLPLISDFEIRDLDRLFSDGHALLTFSLKTQSDTESQGITKSQNIRERPKWDESAKHIFMQNIDIEKVYNITEQIESCLVNQNLNQSLLDSLVQQISGSTTNWNVTARNFGAEQVLWVLQRTGSTRRFY